MSTATATSYRVYGMPLEAKSYDENDDGTLTITGVASTTNKDYANEIVSQEVLESLAKQAPGLNLFRDHNRHYEGGIGAIVDAWVQENMLWIKAVILKEFASGIKERLDIGMNFGFSISGFPRKQRTPEGILIVDYDLKEITLTYIPMNWDTYGTVEYKSLNLVASNCLTGACYHAIHDGENMEEKENTIEEVPEEPVNEKSIAGLSDEQVTQITDLVKNMMNEFVAEFEPRVLETLESKLEGFAEAAGTKAAEETAEKILAELKATQEVEDETEAESDSVEEKDLTNEEDEVVEDEATETEPASEEEEDKACEEEEVKSEAGIAEPTTEEEEVEEEVKEETEEEEEKVEVLDEKSIDKKIHDEIVKQLNEKSIPSKFKKFQDETHKEKTAKAAVKPKRDSFGRNLNYI